MPSFPDAGDVIWVDFGAPFGHEQAGRRPALVLTSRSYNQVSSLITVCPITRNPKPWPFKVALPATAGLAGFVLVDQLRAIDQTARPIKALGQVSDDVLAEVRAKLQVMLFPMASPPSGVASTRSAR